MTACLEVRPYRDWHALLLCGITNDARMRETAARRSNVRPRVMVTRVAAGHRDAARDARRNFPHESPVSTHISPRCGPRPFGEFIRVGRRCADERVAHRLR